MKARESGMPDEEMWEQFFDVDKIFDELEINKNVHTLAELGFGYGTFTIPASKRITGNLFAYDIENNLLNNLNDKLKQYNITNVILARKDFIEEGTGLNNNDTDYVMLFNILHAAESIDILREAYRILKDGGKAGVIHWIYDSSTPRGPGMDIRPKPEELTKMLVKTGFKILKDNISLPPYHYGILAVK